MLTGLKLRWGIIGCKTDLPSPLFSAALLGLIYLFFNPISASGNALETLCKRDRQNIPPPPNQAAHPHGSHADILKHNWNTRKKMAHSKLLFFPPSPPPPQSFIPTFCPQLQDTGGEACTGLTYAEPHPPSMLTKLNKKEFDPHATPPPSCCKE